MNSGDNKTHKTDKGGFKDPKRFVSGCTNEHDSDTISWGQWSILCSVKGLTAVLCSKQITPANSVKLLTIIYYMHLPANGYLGHQGKKLRKCVLWSTLLFVPVLLRSRAQNGLKQSTCIWLLGQRDKFELQPGLVLNSHLIHQMSANSKRNCTFADWKKMKRKTETCGSLTEGGYTPANCKVTVKAFMLQVILRPGL